MKKNLLVSLCLGTVFAVASQASASSCQINSGAYAGISAGVSALTGANQFTFDNDANIAGNFENQDKVNSALSKTSAAAGLFAGYGMKFSNFWAAAELFYQFDSLKNKDSISLTTSANKSLKTQSTGAYGGAIHLGFLPSNNCIFYAILGAEARNFKVTFNDTNAPRSIYAEVNKKYTSIAFAPGVGVRFSLTKNISIRTEYKYAMHRSKKITAQGAHAGAAAYQDKVTIKSSPKVHSFNIGAVYTF